MKVITSQSYINDEIVNQKIEQISGQEFVELPVWTTDLKDDDGNELCVLADGHHTYEAATELGIEVRFVEQAHPEGLTGEALLEAAWMDSDYRYLGTETNVW